MTQPILITLSGQKARLLASYKAYLAAGPKPKSKLSNPRNLFDDLNSVDRVIYLKSVDALTRQPRYHYLV